jgi:hypothetical protein
MFGPRYPTRTHPRNAGTRIIVPWKAMLIASVALTVVVNVVLWLGRA